MIDTKSYVCPYFYTPYQVLITMFPVHSSSCLVCSILGADYIHVLVQQWVHNRKQHTHRYEGIWHDTMR